MPLYQNVKVMLGCLYHKTCKHVIVLMMLMKNTCDPLTHCRVYNSVCTRTIVSFEPHQQRMEHISWLSEVVQKDLSHDYEYTHTVIEDCILGHIDINKIRLKCIFFRTMFHVGWMETLLLTQSGIKSSTLPQVSISPCSLLKGLFVGR